MGVLTPLRRLSDLVNQAAIVVCGLYFGDTGHLFCILYKLITGSTLSWTYCWRGCFCPGLVFFP